MADESYVQVSPDGSGKKIKNLRVLVRTLDSSGNATDEYRYVQQVVATDDDGTPIDLAAILYQQSMILDECRRNLYVIGQLMIQANNLKDSYDKLLAEVPSTEIPPG